MEHNLDIEDTRSKEEGEKEYAKINDLNVVIPNNKKEMISIKSIMEQVNMILIEKNVNQLERILEEVSSK